MTEQGRATPASTVLMLWLGLGVVLAIRLVALHYNATDLFFDEAQYWSWAREPALGYYSKPPLIAWLIGAATGICGDSESCIRLPAPIIHTLTSAVIYLIGARLHGPETGLWAALGFLTLPGVSLSSGIISTDVPLLLFWALALWAFIHLAQSGAWWPALVLGLATGLGLNAKYAMVFFAASAAVYLWVTPAARALLRDPRLYAAIAIAALSIAPNVLWNLQNSFATFAHTADNAKWGGSLLNTLKGLEFLAAQLAVFGPILSAGLVVATRRAWLEGLSEGDRLLLSFTLPVLILVTLQAFISRAHANWAATAYVAGGVLVTAALLRHSGRRWLKGSLALHGAVLLVLAVGTAAAGRFRLPAVGDPCERTLGWRQLAGSVQQALEVARMAGRPYRAVMTDDRSLTAELIYYMRVEPTPVLAWRDGGRPRDHYELTRPFVGGAQEPVLLVSIRRDAGAITRRFSRVETLGERSIPVGAGEPRKVRLFALSGLKPR